MKKLGNATVTVVVACYNHGRFLAEALDSIRAQTRPVGRIIVVDDGSTDETAQVASQFPEVAYVFQQNSGLAAARNAGLRLASSDHILFLDADDVLLPTAIADALQAFEAGPGAAFVYGGYREVTAERQLLWETIPPKPEHVFEALLAGNYIAMHGTVLYDRAKLDSSGGFDEALRSCEDYDVYLRLARRYPVGHYPSVAAEYRRHGDTLSGDNLRMIQFTRLVLKRHRVGNRLTPNERRAFRRGLEFMTGFYATRAIDQIVHQIKHGHPREAIRLALDGLRKDPKFAARLSGRAIAIVRRRMRRSLVRRGATNGPKA